MRNKLQTLLIIFAAIVLFTACEKDETPETFDSISGVLSAGENITAEDLNGLEIYLGKFHDSVNFDNITFQTTAIDSLAATTLNSDGSFSFNNLALGNYGLIMKNGFIFSLDTALSINLNGNSECIIRKIIDRLPEENFSIPPCGSNSQSPHLLFTDIDLKIINLNPTYRVKKVHCYFNSVYHDNAYVFDVDEEENTRNRHRIYQQWTPDNSGATPEYPIFITTEEIEFEIWKYNNGVVTDTIFTTRIPSCCIHEHRTPNTTWPGNDIDISWFEYSKTVTGKLWWKKTTSINPHYEISVHK